MSEPTDDLYRNEEYKGSKEEETAEFQRHVQQVLAAQQRLARKHFAGQPHRVFHSKSHGCLKGKLNLLEDRPEWTRHGIFAANGKTSYDVLVRFSNGMGSNQHDLIPDVRGIGVKIFGISDPSTNPDAPEPRTIDFLMTNSTNGFGRDQEEFVEFMEANVEPGPLKLKLLGYLLKHRRVAWLLIKASFRIVKSVTTQRYWSGHAYLLGPDQAMKFNVRPHQQPAIERPSKLNRNYLSIDLLSRARRGPIKFVFCVQRENQDPKLTPIENGLVEWKESDSPSTPVAHLVLDQQDDSSDCDDLSFTPGHRIAAHRPLGNIGRGRIFTYEASQKGRSASSEETPVTG